MTRRRGESRVRWLKRLATTFVLRGFPAFCTGDRVLIVDDDARAVLGSTGTVEEVVAPFHDWEFRVVGDEPESTNPTRYPAEGTLLTAEQIIAITGEDGEGQ
jgi:hypothetical protein